MINPNRANYRLRERDRDRDFLFLESANTLAHHGFCLYSWAKLTANACFRETNRPLWNSALFASIFFSNKL